MQNLTRLWRYKKLFKLFNRFQYEKPTRPTAVRLSKKSGLPLPQGQKRIHKKRIADEALQCVNFYFYFANGE